jgi:hypothetical protein
MRLRFRESGSPGWSASWFDGAMGVVGANHIAFRSHDPVAVHRF